MQGYRIASFALIVVLALASVGLPPDPTQAQGQSGAQPTTSQQTGRPTPRPELAVGLRDLPPGYEEAPSLELMLDDNPLQDAVLSIYHAVDITFAGPALKLIENHKSDRYVRVQSVAMAPVGRSQVGPAASPVMATTPADASA